MDFQDQPRSMGISAYSAPQSEISGAVLAVKMEQKISQELYNISLYNPVFIRNSEIVLRMIARNDPVDLPLFYGTRIMQISALTSTNNWFWCPGILNHADVLTRSGSTLEKIRSRFWLQGSFLLYSGIQLPDQIMCVPPPQPVIHV